MASQIQKEQIGLLDSVGKIGSLQEKKLGSLPNSTQKGGSDGIKT